MCVSAYAHGVTHRIARAIHIFSAKQCAVIARAATCMMARISPFIRKLLICTCCFVVGTFTWHVNRVPVDDSTTASWSAATLGASTLQAHARGNGSGEFCRCCYLTCHSTHLATCRSAVGAIQGCMCLHTYECTLVRYVRTKLTDGRRS